MPDDNYTEDANGTSDSAEASHGETEDRWHALPFMTPEEERAVGEHLVATFGPYMKRADQNLARVSELITIWEVNLVDEVDPSLFTDVLRSAVVLLHATLEDFLRTVEMTYLPNADPTVLDDLWLSRPSNSSKAAAKDKFFSIGKLAQHRGKTVDDVIRESVEDYLKQRSYSKQEDITEFFQRTGIPNDAIDRAHYLPIIGEMMARRHQIVHHADAVGVEPDGDLIIASIDESQVKYWLDAVNDFHTEVLDVLIHRNLLDPSNGRLADILENLDSTRFEF